MNLSNMKIAGKLAIYVALSALIMICIGVTGYQSLQASRENMQTYEQRVKAERALAGEQLVIRKMQIAFLDSAVARPDVVTEKTPYEKQRGNVIPANDGNIKEFEKNWEDYKSVAPDKPDIQAGIAQSEKDWAKFRDTMKKSDDLLVQGKDKESLENYVAPVKDATTAIKKDLGELEKDTLADMEQVQANNEAELGRAVRNMTIVTLVGILLLSLFTWWIVREIRTPLRRMITVCKEFLDCDFRDKGLSTREGGDEFREMERALEHMRQRLATLFAQIKQSSEKVTNSASMLTQTSMQSAPASSQIASSVSQAASLVDEQQEAVESSLHSMEKVADAMESVRTQTDRTAENSGHARDNAVSGSKAIGASTRQMEKVRDSVQSSAEFVNILGDRSDEIGKIVDTIATIAEQTNLLALNAAIEAARAGEQGKGFAVVAENVRKLAEQSQEAAKQIAEMIQTIQSDTQDAVQAMQGGQTQVEAGAEQMRRLQDIFGSIEQLVVATASQAGAIAEAVAGAAGDMSDATAEGRRVQEHSSRVADEMQSVSAAAEEQSAAAEEVAAASESLTKLAGELNEAVKAFRY